MGLQAENKKANYLKIGKVLTTRHRNIHLPLSVEIMGIWLVSVSWYYVHSCILYQFIPCILIKYWCILWSYGIIFGVLISGEDCSTQMLFIVIIWIIWPREDITSPTGLAKCLHFIVPSERGLQGLQNDTLQMESQGIQNNLWSKHDGHGWKAVLDRNSWVSLQQYEQYKSMHHDAKFLTHGDNRVLSFQP